MYNTEKCIGSDSVEKNKKTDRSMVSAGVFPVTYGILKSVDDSAGGAGGRYAVLCSDGSVHGAGHLRAGRGYETKPGEHYQDHDAADHF